MKAVSNKQRELMKEFYGGLDPMRGMKNVNENREYEIIKDEGKGSYGPKTIPCYKTRDGQKIGVVSVCASAADTVNAAYRVEFVDNDGNAITEVKAYIIKTLGHDITTFEVKGGFLEKNRKVMLTVIPSREYYKVTEGIKAIDRDAFFLVTDSYQVEGGK